MSAEKVDCSLLYTCWLFVENGDCVFVMRWQWERVFVCVSVLGVVVFLGGGGGWRGKRNGLNGVEER